MGLINYLEKGKTINEEYYVALLEQLNDDIKVKRPHLAKKKILFRQDNALAHTSAIAVAKLHELHFELLSHAIELPSYCADVIALQRNSSWIRQHYNKLENRKLQDLFLYYIEHITIKSTLISCS